jgi:hypothetical protein
LVARVKREPTALQDIKEEDVEMAEENDDGEE